MKILFESKMHTKNDIYYVISKYVHRKPQRREARIFSSRNYNFTIHIIPRRKVQSCFVR